MTIGEVAKIKHGFAFKGEFFTEVAQPTVLVTPGNFAVGGGFQSGKQKFYAGPVPEDYVLETGDLVVTMTDLSKASDTLGYAARIPQVPEVTYLHNQRIGLVQMLDETKVRKDWLHYLMRTDRYRAWVIGSASGTTVKHTSPSRIESYSFFAPPLYEQAEAASLLDALEDRIDSFRQTNTTLEAIAQALFKSWFVDFDPVRAKAEGRKPEGMDAATAALFPASFEGSELGDIPRAWQVTSLQEHIIAERGLSYKGAGLAEDGVPMHNLNSVLEGGGYKYSGLKYYRGDYKERHIARPGDIIVANTEQGHHHRLIGFPAIVPRSFETGIYSHHLYRVRIGEQSELTQEWLYHCLMASAVRDQIIGCANGSTVNMLKPAGLQIPRFAAPPEQLCAAFDAIAAPIREATEVNIARIGNLTALRDTLLPRLISGKLRLPETGQEGEAATA